MKKFIVPLLVAVMVVSIIFAGCVPAVEPAPPVTPPPVTPPPVTPPPVTPPPVTPPPVTPPPEAPPVMPPGVTVTAPIPELAREFLEAEAPHVYLGPDLIDIDEAMAFLDVVSKPAVPPAVMPHKLYRIALIFPSLDLSDAWFCAWYAFEQRMKELGIPHEITTMGVVHDDHVMQAAHIDTAIALEYDYVVFGPTELMIQAAGVQRMIEAGIGVIVWNYTDPLRDWGTERYPDGLQPLAWVGFGDVVGGVINGEYALTRLEPGSQVALMHGIPGMLTQCRVGIGAAMMEAAGHEIVYVHYADYIKEKAYEATKALVAAHPDVDLIYNCSTAMSYGIIEALDEMGIPKEQIMVSAYGGGWGEQKYMWEGKLNWTILRMQDDWGVAPAEIIKYDIEGRIDEVPLVVCGGVILINDGMTKEEVGEMMKYAYRYTGVIEY